MIIKSLLSQDLYKYTMLQVFFRKFPDTTSKYRFKCRNNDVNLLEFRNEIQEELNQVCTLKHTTEELEWLSNIRFFTPAFINYLEDFTLKERHIKVGEKDGQIDIVAEGPLTGVSPFEIFVLKIVQEVYMRNVHPMDGEIERQGKENLVKKIISFKDFVVDEEQTPVIIDFGGRRAYSTEWHEYVVKNLVKHDVIIGTSDMDLARRFGIKPIGTFAHEFSMVFQAFYHPMDSQRIAFETWLDIYGSELNVLLSDTLGDKAFLIDYDKGLATLANVRHDSGCPFQFGEMMIEHYNAMGIDPKTKTIVFSDGLDFDKMFKIQKRFHGRIKVSFGIGTNLSNNLGIKPLQNVIKIVEANGRPVAKISNDIGKCMCEDDNYLNYLRNILNNL